jgi:hypothetical protein
LSTALALFFNIFCVGGPAPQNSGTFHEPPSADSLATILPRHF